MRAPNKDYKDTIKKNIFDKIVQRKRQMTNVIMIIRKKVKLLKNDPEKIKKFYLQGKRQDLI